MKRTKSMIYNPTTESRELFLYATNDSNLYFSAIVPTIESLRKKYKKGVYDHEKSVDAFYYIATRASEKYGIDYGYKFNVQDRFSCAVEMVEYYEENIFSVDF